MRVVIWKLTNVTVEVTFEAFQLQNTLIKRLQKWIIRERAILANGLSPTLVLVQHFKDVKICRQRPLRGKKMRAVKLKPIFKLFVMPIQAAGEMRV